MTSNHVNWSFRWIDNFSNEPSSWFILKNMLSGMNSFRVFVPTLQELIMDPSLQLPTPLPGTFVRLVLKIDILKS